MSLSLFNSSLSSTAIHNHLLLSSVPPQASNHAQGRVIEVVPKPIGYILGEQLSNLFSFFYSKLPSLSLPGAQANACVDLSCRADPCKLPSGSYAESCHSYSVTYLPEEDVCVMSAYCKGMIEAIPPQANELKFYPEDDLFLGNHNGTLSILSESKINHVKRANKELNQGFDKIKEIDQKLKDSTIEADTRKELERDKENLLKQQEEIVGKLKVGDVITLDHEGRVTVLSKEDLAHNPLYSTEVHESYQRLAILTDGVMGLSSSPENLPPVIEKLFDHILYGVQPGESVDVAFVLDTTASMDNDIAQVKINLTRFLSSLKEKKSSNAFRVSLVEYRDSNDHFLNRVNMDFTTDLDQVARAINRVETDGGGDFREAVYDALLAAQEKLAWNPSAKHVVILIGDAPPHCLTVDERFGEFDVITRYQLEDIKIAIYPIVT